MAFYDCFLYSQIQHLWLYFWHIFDSWSRGRCCVCLFESQALFMLASPCSVVCWVLFSLSTIVADSVKICQAPWARGDIVQPPLLLHHRLSGLGPPLRKWRRSELRGPGGGGVRDTRNHSWSWTAWVCLAWVHFCVEFFNKYGLLIVKYLLCWLNLWVWRASCS